MAGPWGMKTDQRSSYEKSKKMARQRWIVIEQDAGLQIECPADIR